MKNIQFVFNVVLHFLIVAYTDGASIPIYSKSPTGCGFQGYAPGKGPKKVGAVKTAAAKLAKSHLAKYLGPITKVTTLGAHGKNLLNTVIKGFADSAPKLAPSLMVFGAIASIVNDAPGPADIIAAANLAMSELSADVNEKITSMQGYVDKKITKELTDMLQRQYQKQFNLWTACIDEWEMSEVNECQRDRIFQLEGMKADFARHYDLLEKDQPPSADAITAGQFTCEFQPSDGVGGTEQFHDINGNEACLRKCIAEKAKDPSINGVTTRRANTGCWCEKNMEAIDRSNEVATTYKSCFLVDKDIYSASYSCRLRNGDGISKEEKRVAGIDYKCWVNKRCEKIDGIKVVGIYDKSKREIETLCNENEKCSGFVYWESLRAAYLCREDTSYPGDIPLDNVVLCQKPKKQQIDSIQLSSETGDNCIKKCMEEKKTNNHINGVTTTKNGAPGCWCQINMVEIDKDASGDVQSCFLYKKTNDLDWEQIREIEAYMLPARNAFNLIIMIMKPLIEVRTL